MKFRRIIITIIITSTLLSCDNTFRKNFKESVENMQELKNVEFSKPDYRIDQIELIEEIKTLSNSDLVKLNNPIFYVSPENYNIWIKVSILNPKIEKENDSLFSKKIALKVLDNLINQNEFEKIEVSITEKKGGVISVSKTENFIFPIEQDK